MAPIAVRRIALFAGLLAILALGATACDTATDSRPVFTDRAGPYLGQTPPGETPELFANELLSLGNNEGNITFTPDGLALAWSVSVGGDRILPRPKWPFGCGFVMQSRVAEGRWLEATMLQLPADRPMGYPCFSPDGTKLFFNYRPDRGDTPDTLATNMWWIEKQGDIWSEPTEVRFEGEFSGKREGIYPSVAANGNLYFGVFPDGRHGVIHRSRYVDGKYLAPEPLYDELQNYGNHVFIAADESYMIFDWEHPDEQYGENDLLISFRDNDGTWMRAQNLGAKVNSRFHDWRPFVSRDGKYLFFSSNRLDSAGPPDEPATITHVRELMDSPTNGWQHIYWVDASVIEEARAKFAD